MRNPKAAEKASIQSIWSRIDAWFAEHWFTRPTLPPGALESELAQVESVVGSRLPRDARESYLLHDGTGDLPLIPFGPWQVVFPLLGLAGMVGQWKMIQDAVRKGHFSGQDFVNHPKGPIRKTWFHQRWLPIVDDQGGDYLFLDLAPARGGKQGQIIDFFRDAGATNVVAQGLRECLQRTALELESGKFKVDKKSRTLVPS